MVLGGNRFYREGIGVIDITRHRLRLLAQRGKLSPVDIGNGTGGILDIRVSGAPGVAPPHEKDPLRRVFVIQDAETEAYASPSK